MTMSAGMAPARKGKVGIDLTEGPIAKCLITFASPIVLAAIIQQLYSMVDLMVIGQFMQGSAGTIGVSTGGEIADLMTPVATSFGTAGQIYIAQLVGAKNKERIHSAMGTLLSLMLVAAAVFALVTFVFAEPLLHLINCPESGFAQARNYMRITALGIPFIFGYNAVCGVLRGMGESKAPMLFIIVAAISNIFLDILLVAVIPLEAAGTAIATIVAQIASFAAAFLYLYRHKEQFSFELKRSSFSIDRRDLKVICSIGIPQVVRSILVHVSMLWVNASVNAFGATASATNSVGNKLQKFLEIFTTSLSQASGAMVGQNLGAKKQDRARKTVLTAFAISFSIACVIALLTYNFPQPIFRIFTQDEDVLAFCPTYMHIMVFHYLWAAVCSSFQSMVIGCGNASLNFVLGILDGIVCKIGISALFAYALGFGVTGFFIGTAWSRSIPALINIYYFFSNKWAKRKLLTEE